jgi:hypothetical protein
VDGAAAVGAAVTWQVASWGSRDGAALCGRDAADVVWP